MSSFNYTPTSLGPAAANETMVDVQSLLHQYQPVNPTHPPYPTQPLYTISRSASDYTKLEFDPPLESDDLWEALKLTYPHERTHQMRKRAAVTDFLNREVFEVRDTLQSMLTTGEAVSEGLTTTAPSQWAAPGLPLSGPSPPGLHVSTNACPPEDTPYLSASNLTAGSLTPDNAPYDMPWTPDEAMLSRPAPLPFQPPTPTLSVPAPSHAKRPAPREVNSLESLTSVLDMSMSPTKVKKRRAVTARERHEINEKRKLGTVCDDCKRRKKRCHHALTNGSAGSDEDLPRRSRAHSRSHSRTPSTAPCPTQCIGEAAGLAVVPDPTPDLDLLSPNQPPLVWQNLDDACLLDEYSQWLPNHPAFPSQTSSYLSPLDQPMDWDWGPPSEIQPPHLIIPVSRTDSGLGNSISTSPQSSSTRSLTDESGNQCRSPDPFMQYLDNLTDLHNPTSRVPQADFPTGVSRTARQPRVADEDTTSCDHTRCDKPIPLIDIPGCVLLDGRDHISRPTVDSPPIDPGQLHVAPAAEGQIASGPPQLVRDEAAHGLFSTGDSSPLLTSPARRSHSPVQNWMEDPQHLRRSRSTLLARRSRSNMYSEPKEFNCDLCPTAGTGSYRTVNDWRRHMQNGAHEHARKSAVRPGSQTAFVAFALPTTTSSGNAEMNGNHLPFQFGVIGIPMGLTPTGSGYATSSSRYAATQAAGPTIMSLQEVGDAFTVNSDWPNVSLPHVPLWNQTQSQQPQDALLRDLLVDLAGGWVDLEQSSTLDLAGDSAPPVSENTEVRVRPKQSLELSVALLYSSLMTEFFNFVSLLYYSQRELYNDTLRLGEYTWHCSTSSSCPSRDMMAPLGPPRVLIAGFVVL